MMNEETEENLVTALDFIKHQNQMEKEAFIRMPYDFKECTYGESVERQILHSCLTCSKTSQKPIGICYSCSIYCHADHELVDLFEKRNFVCDCGTSRMNGEVCRLRNKNFDKFFFSQKTKNENEEEKSRCVEKMLDVPSLSNRYNQNFEGFHCTCRQKYGYENDTKMVQCYFGTVCGEDWYHGHCIFGFENSDDTEINKTIEDFFFDNFSETETYICWKCTAKFASVFEQFDSELVRAKIPYLGSISDVKEKKSTFNLFKKNFKSENTSRKKRIKLDFTIEKTSYSLILANGFKKILSKKFDILSETTYMKTFFLNYDFMYKEELTYVPPLEIDNDPENEKISLLKLGTKALRNLPKEKALAGLSAYNDIKTKIFEFLKPFSEEKKVVTEKEIKDFFVSIKNNTQ